MFVRKRNERSGYSYDRIESGGENNQKTGLQGDGQNVAILFFLYLLQGIPLGLMQAVPIILVNTGITYRQQAQFSLVFWPFSLKLLWAPIVDTVYWRRVGRRKSWLVPTQYLIAIVMMLMSFRIDNWLGLEEGSEVKLEVLVLSFLVLNFLAATQDIAVDGWALTMLKRHVTCLIVMFYVMFYVVCYRQNVEYAGTCNSVGQTAGYFLGYVVFIALESTSFCNAYLRSEAQPHGIVTLAGFLWFWGWAFLVTTSLVWVFKKETTTPVHERSASNTSIKQSYLLLWKIAKLPPVKTLAVLLLTAKIAFSACDAVTGLKLIEAGVPKDKIALLAVPLVPLQVLLPLCIARYTVGPTSFQPYIGAYPYRLFMSLLIVLFIYVTPALLGANKTVPFYYYALLLVLYAVHQVTVNTMFVSQMAFFAKVSDPSSGGTYMTLLNTLSNMGGNWPQTLALWAVDSLTYRQCSNSGLDCSSSDSAQVCETGGGSCDVSVDGYYVESALCTVIGLVWLLWGRGAVRRLQTYQPKAFSVALQSR